ncbi:MAG TPA: hypothetical protein VGV69_03895 [Solirubrobacterales bacterium]|nr:hypothetical protein [Solirubrobacterales bacterium]
MKQWIHPIAGGLVALSAAVLLTFATDSSTQPTSWAIPATAGLLVVACVTWLTTRSRETAAGAGVQVSQKGGGQQNSLIHSGHGDVVHGAHIEHHHYGETSVDDKTELDTALRTADKATFEDLVKLVSRNEINFLKEHDFGNAWPDRIIYPLYGYRASRDAVEHQFHDQVLEGQRTRLHDAIKGFTEQLSSYSVPAESGNSFFELNEKQWVRSHPPGDETYRRFQAHRRELGELADVVVEAYDDLVREARRRVP